MQVLVQVLGQYYNEADYDLSKLSPKRCEGQAPCAGQVCTTLPPGTACESSFPGLPRAIPNVPQLCCRRHQHS